MHYLETVVVHDASVGEGDFNFADGFRDWVGLILACEQVPVVRVKLLASIGIDDSSDGPGNGEHDGSLKCRN